MRFDCQATPIELELESTVSVVSEQTPDWNTLSDIMISEASTFSELTSDVDSFEYMNMIGIPNVLAKAYFNSPD